MTTIRTFFVAFFCMMAVPAMSQPEMQVYQAFIIDNKEAIWIEVYHQEDAPENLSQKVFDHLKQKHWITNLKFEGGDIIGELHNYKPDYKRYGGKYLNTSSVIRTGRWSGKVRISFKDGKYRVVIYGLNYLALQAATGSGKATIEQHETSGTLSDLVLNNLRTSFRKKTLKNLDILHFSFKDSFTITVNQIIDSDW
jgi:hypothetical protein